VSFRLLYLIFVRLGLAGPVRAGQDHRRRRLSSTSTPSSCAGFMFVIEHHNRRVHLAGVTALNSAEACVCG
jgi:hypothetical protein